MLNGETEKHHIFPKSIFGKNNILVVLTLKEHFVAHHLLWKYYKKKYGDKDLRTIKCYWTLHRMLNVQGKQIYISARLYEQIRGKWLAEHPMKQKENRDKMKGSNNPMFGKKGILSPSWGSKRTGKTKELQKKLKKPKMKAVLRKDKNGEMKFYESLKEAERDRFSSRTYC